MTWQNRLLNGSAPASPVSFQWPRRAAAPITVQPTVPAAGPAACNYSGTGHRPALQVVWASRARAPRLTAEASLGRRAGRLRQVVCTSKGWGLGVRQGSPCHHVGWLYCLVPPLDPPAPWELLPWCRQRECTASLPAARPAPRAGARTRSPQPAGRFSRVAPPRRTRPWRKTLAPAADGTARMAGTRPARPRSPWGRSAIYPGTAARRRCPAARTRQACTNSAGPRSLLLPHPQPASQPRQGTRPGSPPDSPHMPAAWSTPEAGLPPEKGGMPEPALIDPGLPVDQRAPDYAGTKMGYWPSYSSIPPDCRAAYLHWLLDGRRAPGAHIGYVFLYFYGLERRLLVDSQRSPAARAEHPTLVREVERLLRIYGANGSFSGYAGNLLRFLSLSGGPRRYLSAPPPARQEAWELPFEVRLGLGQLAADARPVPAAWALAWVRMHPAAWLRTPATRCPDEFDELFTRRYREHFGDGMMLDRGGPLLQAAYRPASPGIISRDLPADQRIPDVGNARGSAGKAARARQRRLHRARRLQPLPRTPSRCCRDSRGPRPAPARTRTAGGCRHASAGELGPGQPRHCGSRDRWRRPSSWRAGRRPRREPTRKSDAALLARVLEQYRLGLEPDVRFGGAVPAGEAPACCSAVQPRWSAHRAPSTQPPPRSSSSVPRWPGRWPGCGRRARLDRATGHGRARAGRG